MLFFATVAELGFILFGLWLCVIGFICKIWNGDRWNIESVILLVFGVTIIWLSIHFGVITVGAGG